MSDGAVTDPSLNRTEHVDENISAKRVTPYLWNGSNWQRAGAPGTAGNVVTERYDYSAPPVFYVGTAPVGTSEGGTGWTINKFDLTTSSDGLGEIATNVSWTNRTSGSYS